MLILIITFLVGLVIGGVVGCVIAAFVFYKVANFINTRLKF